ncbi:MAG TPA: YSC84-related protein [Thermoanaerobaculia bacterium]|nr:YSC84-related protein [Thermoanaerobaculia bacterium]
MSLAVVSGPAGAQEPAKEKSAAPAAASPAATPRDRWAEMRLDSKRKVVDAMAGETLERLTTRDPKAKELLEKAYGYAVFDSFKFGIGLSGAGGSGVAVDGKSGKRIYMKMGSAGIGLTLGGQKYQVVFLMQDSETFDRFVTKGWYADASARAAAGKEGGASGTAFVNGLAIYQLNQSGLMASLDISSTWYSTDDDLN